MHILNFDEFCTDWKPWISAFNRYKHHQNWIHISNVMAKISKCSLRSLKFRENRLVEKAPPPPCQSVGGGLFQNWSHGPGFYGDFRNRNLEIAINVWCRCCNFENDFCTDPKAESFYKNNQAPGYMRVKSYLRNFANSPRTVGADVQFWWFLYQTPFESWESGLSIGTKINKLFHYMRQKL